MVLLAATPALAGDRAMANFIGFSEDGRYFAFEEFGVQDGSGFAYASIYILDTQTDSWVVGTPVRAIAKSEDTALQDIRTQAAVQAGPTLDGMAITVPAEIAALIGDGVPDNDARKLRFGAPGFEAPGAVLGDFALSLTSFEAESVSPCEAWFGSKPLGYQLNLAAGGESAQLLHRDETLPRSRGCPQDYRLYGVVIPYDAGSIEQGVAIISVYRGGFEGPDRRFVAVPLGL